jgi:indolepyruvate ferredoxin oxidoreductase, alpha subunit
MSNKDVLQEMAVAFKAGGIAAAYNFPGFNSHKLFDYLGGATTSTNEKIAYELAWGSSQAGKQALVTFKNVGLNDAADPFVNSMLTGVGAGLVLAVFDDIELEGSQCILDSRHYFGFYGGLWLEPFDFKSAVTLAEAAPQLSQLFNIPVVMRLTNRAVRFESGKSRGFPEVSRIIELAKQAIGESRLDTVEPIVHPINGDAQRKLIRAKSEVIQRFVNALHAQINPGGLKGDVYCGHDADNASSHIVTLPVPQCNATEANVIHEVGDAVIAKELMFQTASVELVSDNVGYNTANAQQYIITSRYERLFKLLKPQFDYITGDLGEYTKDTLHTLTHCLCFGSAISAAVGMAEAGKKALAITGDASFYHSAKNAIVEAGMRNISVKVVLLDNGGSQGTGGQKIPGYMPDDIDAIEIDFDAISDQELSQRVEEFVGTSQSVILKVNHKV